MIKVILGGPPHSGKSCLRGGLKQAILDIPGAPYPYVITAVPDGEGAHFQNTISAHPELAAQIKAEGKRQYTPEFVQVAAHWVQNCVQTLTLIDVGGKPDAYNETICGAATHIILLAGDLNCLQEWREFSDRTGLNVFAELQSDYGGAVDRLPIREADGVLRGSIHHLERGEDLRDRPTIRALASFLCEAAVNSELGSP